MSADVGRHFEIVMTVRNHSRAFIELETVFHYEGSYLARLSHNLSPAPLSRYPWE